MFDTITGAPTRGYESSERTDKVTFVAGGSAIVKTRTVTEERWVIVGLSKAAALAGATALASDSTAAAAKHDVGPMYQVEVARTTATAWTTET